MDKPQVVVRVEGADPDAVRRVAEALRIARPPGLLLEGMSNEPPSRAGAQAAREMVIVVDDGELRAATGL